MRVKHLKEKAISIPNSPVVLFELKIELLFLITTILKQGDERSW